MQGELVLRYTHSCVKHRANGELLYNTGAQLMLCADLKRGVAGGEGGSKGQGYMYDYG